MMFIEKTLTYYDINAKDFFETTVEVDVSTLRNRFLKYVKNGGVILDFGCGSGRDTKAFLDLGYEVEAIDGSKELCRKASQFTGVEVKKAHFEDLNESNKYDGIWACSSILHLDRSSLKNVINKMMVALKEDGAIYTSFKYGDFEGERNGRFFTDFTEESFLSFIEDVEGLSIKEAWITSDVRPGRGEEKWLNLILKNSKKY